MPDSIKVKWWIFTGKVFHRYFPLLLGLWILFVLYPNPLNLIISVHRIFSPDVDPGAVEPMLEGLSSDPVAIEKTVQARITYNYDWEVHGMPWYFPATKVVLEKEKGDCKARALVLASIFEAKNIPYYFNCSPIHMWVDYEGKMATSLENPKVKFYQRDPETGKRFFQIPDIELGEVMESFWRSFWNPMPEGRKALLVFGLFILGVVRVILFKKQGLGY